MSIESSISVAFYPDRNTFATPAETLLAQSKDSLKFPAYFQFIAAMNPCPCGWLNDAQKACGCAAAVVTKYQKRISGPILDRIDIHIEVPRVDYEKLSEDRVGESSASIRAPITVFSSWRAPLQI